MLLKAEGRPSKTASGSSSSCLVVCQPSGDNRIDCANSRIVPKEEMESTGEQNNIAYTIRAMTAADVPTLSQLSNLEGWNTTEEQVEYFRSLSTDTYLVAEAPDGLLLGFCCASVLSDMEGHLDFYVTRTDYRRRGIGTGLFRSCMAALGDRNIGLAAEAAHQPMYEAMGFPVLAYRITDICGRPRYKELDGLEIASSRNIVVKSLTESLLADIVAYDGEVCKTPRQDLLIRWIKRSVMQTYVAIETDKIVGYMCISPSEKGFRVMPLYANDVDVARAIWKHAVYEIRKDALIFVSPSADNASALSLYKQTLIYETGYPMDVVKLYNRYSVKHNMSAVYSMQSWEGSSV